MNGTPTQMQPSVAAEASSGEAFEPATVARRSRFISYRSYLLVLLILIHAIVLTERFALSISLQSIKRDMGLSDTLLGLMSGLAFTVFYAAMGIPIGLWADRGSRVKVVSVTMFIWGVMVALCGAVGNFVQLLLVRVGVAIGEAGGLTPSYSLISEHFGRAERPRALGLFALGAPISLLISFLAAGWLNQTYGWRTMFVVIASPGVVLAILAAATLRDPRSSKSQTSAQPLRNDTAPSVLDVVAYLGRNRTFRRMVLATSLNFFFLYALFQWQPTFFGLAHIGRWRASLPVPALLGLRIEAVRVVTNFVVATRLARIKAAFVQIKQLYLMSSLGVRFPRQPCEMTIEGLLLWMCQYN